MLFGNSVLVFFRFLVEFCQNDSGDFLECSDVTSMEIKSLLSAPRTLRSQVSMSVTTISSYKVALAKADEQVALLKVTHLKRQLDSEREEGEIKFKQEMLLANQRAEEASSKCQVLDEEIDRGGYILSEPCTFDEIALRLDADAAKSLPTKKLSPLSRLIQNSFEVDVESAFDMSNTVTSASRLPDSSVTENEFIPPQPRVQFNEANLSQARNNLGSVNEQFADQLLPLVSALQLQRDFSQLEVMKFDGEPSKYAKFVSTFEQTVGVANLSVNKKLLYLLQHCQGKAINN